MAIQNQTIIDAASTAFRAKFDEVFAAQPAGAWQLYTEQINTDALVNEVDLLETQPIIQEWTGAKRFQSVRASNFTATIKSYERSFEIKRLSLLGDRTGLIGRRISNLMGDAGQIYDNLCFAGMIANPVGYDGVAVYNNAHPRGPGGATQSNITTSAFSFAQHDAIMAAGASLRDENSEPLRISYDTLIVGPSLKKLATEVTQSRERIVPITAAGVTDAAASNVAAATIPNVYGGGEMTLVVDPRLVGTNAAKYLYVDSKRGPKPFIIYVFRSPTPVEQTQMDNDGRFMHDVFRYSVEADLVVTAGAWQVSYFGNA